jgi:hypothetical protein
VSAWPIVTLAVVFAGLLGLRVVILLILRRGESGARPQPRGEPPRVARLPRSEGTPERAAEHGE